jgi:hypothetical protein
MPEYENGVEPPAGRANAPPTFVLDTAQDPSGVPPPGIPVSTTTKYVPA